MLPAFWSNPFRAKRESWFRMMGTFEELLKCAERGMYFSYVMKFRRGSPGQAVFWLFAVTAPARSIVNNNRNTISGPTSSSWGRLSRGVPIRYLPYLQTGQSWMSSGLGSTDLPSEETRSLPKWLKQHLK